MTERLLDCWRSTSARVEEAIRTGDSTKIWEFLGAFDQVLDAWTQKDDPSAATLPMLMALAVKATRATYDAARGRLNTCVHEAGHAVAAFVLGVPFTEISVVVSPTMNSLGHVQLEKGPPTDGAHTTLQRLEVEAHMQVEMAGPMAEDWGRDSNETSWNLHSESARRMAMHIRPALDPPGMEAFMNWNIERTRNLVMMHWPAVDALARAVMERDKLTGDEARVVIERALTGRTLATIEAA